MRKGDYVRVEHGGQSVTALVAFASRDGDPLIILFDGMFLGYVQMMPVLKDGGVYADVAEGRDLRFTPAEPPAGGLFRK